MFRVFREENLKVRDLEHVYFWINIRANVMIVDSALLIGQQQRT